MICTGSFVSVKPAYDPAWFSVCQRFFGQQFLLLGSVRASTSRLFECNLNRRKNGTKLLLAHVFKKTKSARVLRNLDRVHPPA